MHRLAAKLPSERGFSEYESQEMVVYNVSTWNIPGTIATALGHACILLQSSLPARPASGEISLGT